MHEQERWHSASVPNSQSMECWLEYRPVNRPEEVTAVAKSDSGHTDSHARRVSKFEVHTRGTLEQGT